MEKHVSDIFIFLLTNEWIRQWIVVKGQCVPVKQELEENPALENGKADSQDDLDSDFDNTNDFEEKESDKKDDKDSKGDPKEQKPQQQKISNAQAKRILEAAEKAEKEIQNKLNKQKVIVGEKGKAGTKKDW